MGTYRQIRQRQRLIQQLTIQSSAFFITPVTPCAYSGLASKTRSALESAFLQWSTAGVGLDSSSILKRGILSSESYISNLIPIGQSKDIARKKTVFSEAARRLPDTPNTCFTLIILMRPEYLNCLPGQFDEQVLSYSSSC